jgi:hypothetical protein
MSTDLDALYAELNVEHFDGLLPTIPIYRGLPEATPFWRIPLSSLAYTMTPGEGDELAIYLREAPWDVLLHEMVHVAIWVRYGNRGHGIRFTRECNRIGAKMGWAEVDHGSMAAHWPWLCEDGLTPELAT